MLMSTMSVEEEEAVQQELAQLQAEALPVRSWNNIRVVYSWRMIDRCLCFRLFRRSQKANQSSFHRSPKPNPCPRLVC